MARPSKLSNKAKFAIVGIGFLAVAGITMLILAIALHWDIIGGLTHPIAIVMYAIVGVAATLGISHIVAKKIKGSE